MATGARHGRPVRRARRPVGVTLRADRRHRLDRHRPPDALPGPVRRPARSPTSCDRVSLSFLVDDLVVRRGGVAANIAFGTGRARAAPAPGRRRRAPTSRDYRAWLTRHGVDCYGGAVCDDVHTARFVCTTDDDMRQIASFYAGAMAEAREIELARRRPGRRPRPGADQRQRPRGDGPAHRGVPGAAASRSPPTPRSSWPGWTGRTIRRLSTAPRYLFTNDYEWELLQQKTGLDRGRRRCERVEHPDHHARREGRGDRRPGRPALHGRRGARDRPRSTRPASATASGAGFLAAPSTAGWSLERAAQLGASLIAVLVLETVGPQEWTLGPGARAVGSGCGDAYGRGRRRRDRRRRYLPSW